MTNPEQKAAERICNQYLCSMDKAEAIVAIIRECNAPMRTMMERMAHMMERSGIGVGILCDYAAMKAEWEAENEG